MKIYSLTFLFFLSSIGFSVAPIARNDSAYRPAAFEARVGQFKTYPTSSKDIVFLGNSITAGIDWAEFFQNPRLKNRGISGDVTYGVLERLGQITSGKPQKIFILIGTNDLSYGVSNMELLQNYRKIVSQIKKESPKTEIYIQSILPINEQVSPGRNPNQKTERIKEINSALAEICKHENVTFIDLYSYFAIDDKLNPVYTYDGIHLTMEGYLQWKKVLLSGKYL